MLPHGYSIVSVPRPEKANLDHGWGGVAAIIHDSVSFTWREDLSTPDILVLQLPHIVAVNAYLYPANSRVDRSTSGLPDPADRLEELVAALRADGHFIHLSGDFNARTQGRSAAPNIDPPRNSMDKEPVNTRGSFLLRLAADNDLCILNGAVDIDQVDGGMYTSYQHNGFATVDYALVPRDALEQVTHFHIQPQLDFGDHAVLYTRLKTDFARRDRQAQPRNRFQERSITDCVEFSDLDRELQELFLSRRSWEDAMGDLFGPLRCGPENPITVFTDGSSLKDHTGNARAGAGVYWGPDCVRNSSVRVPGASQTNNRAELYAMLLALQQADPALRLIVYSDSEYAIRSVAEWAPMRAELGWSCTNGEVLRDICAQIRTRGAGVHFVWVKAHAQNAHNDAADKLAKDGAAGDAVPVYTPPPLPNTVFDDPVVPGLKVTMSLRPRASDDMDNLFTREFDLQNEPWFKLKDGSWSQDPSRWRDRKRDAHRDRAMLAALQESNLKQLMSSHSRSSFWKIVNKWCSAKNKSVDVEPDPLADAFERRLHHPEELPPEFDTSHRDAMRALRDLLPLSDGSGDGTFSRDITVAEVAHAKVLVSSRLKTAKGADEASYKEVLAIPNDLLAAFFSKCIREGSTPNIWNLTLLIAVPKAKGPFDNPDNVRMIALECCILKLLTTIIDSRIRSYCDRTGLLPHSQNGFRPGYRTENNAYILRTAIESAHAHGKSLYVAFVDLKNAFPSVDRDVLWAKIAARGIHGPIISWLRSLYSDMRYRLTIDGSLSDEMASDVGILMGDPASPLAFLLYIADFTTTPHADDVTLGAIPVSHLEHADDMVLFSTSEEGLQMKLDDLGLWASLNQMQVNVQKTVVMAFHRPQSRNRPAPLDLRLYGKPLELKSKQSYVGVTFSSDAPNMWEDHTRACEKRARLAANKIMFIESHVGPLPPWEGRILYRSQVDPHLTWACEVTGVGTGAQVGRLADVQHYFLRRLLRLQSRSQLCVLFSELDTWPVKTRRLELQLRYLRHLLSLPDDHLARAALTQSLLTAQTRTRSWFAELRAAAAKAGLVLTDNPSIPEIDSAIVHLASHVRDDIRTQVAASAKLELLQSRRDFSSGSPRASPVLAFRSYLRLPAVDLRQALTRVLLSEHPLSVERLRWRDGRSYDIPREMRLCRFCRTDVEEPLHCLFHCKASQDLLTCRKAFWASVSRALPPTTSLASLRSFDDDDLFHALLSAEGTTEPLALLCAQMLDIYARTQRYIPTQQDVLDAASET